LAVLFVSSEVEEVLDVSDRILIINQGRITGEVSPEDVSLEHLLALVMEEITT
jgi:ABC-type sugar transport system ATPase subunit